MSFAPVVSWPLVVLVSLALAWLVFWVYRARLAGQPAKVRATLMTLRAAMWLVLTLAMLRPSVEWTEPDERPRQLNIVADMSRSMTVADAAGGKTRRDALLELIERNAGLLEGDDLVQIRRFDFAGELAPVETLSQEADGDWTDLAGVIEKLSEESRGQRTLATVLLTDGANRTPTPTGAKAIGAATKFAEQTGASVHSVVFGSADLSSGGVDLAIEDVLVEPMTFVKKTVPVRAKVRLSGFEGRSTRVRVLLENRDGVDEGETGPFAAMPVTATSQPMREVTASSNDLLLPVDLSFIAEKPGDYKLRVEVEAVDGEAQRANNVKDMLISVRKNGLRVAYFDTARWEQKFLRQINRTARIQLDYVFVPDADSLTKMTPTAEWFEPDAYDVFLIGDVPPEVFRGDNEFGVKLIDRVRRGAGLGVIGGAKLLGEQPPSFLKDVLPARWRGHEPRTNKGGFAFQPTPVGMGSFVLRGVASEWAKLPPLERVFDIRPRNEAVPVLAETPQGDPLIIAAETGRSRTAVLATADTWLWYRAGFPDVQQRFWTQLLLWLGRKEQDNEKPIWVTVEPRTVDQGRPVQIAYGARTPEGLPRGDATFALQVTTPTGQIMDLAAGSGEAPVTEFPNTDEPGDYWITVNATTPEGAELTDTTRLLVNRRDAELDSPAADPAMLEQIASASGGVVLTPDRFDDWLADLLKASRESDVVKTTSLNLWDGWPLLVVFIALLSTEWTIRRLRGMV